MVLRYLYHRSHVTNKLCTTAQPSQLADFSSAIPLGDVVWWQALLLEVRWAQLGGLAASTWGSWKLPCIVLIFFFWLQHHVVHDKWYQRPIMFKEMCSNKYSYYVILVLVVAIAAFRYAAMAVVKKDIDGAIPGAKKQKTANFHNLWSVQTVLESYFSERANCLRSHWWCIDRKTKLIS